MRNILLSACITVLASTAREAGPLPRDPERSSRAVPTLTNTRAVEDPAPPALEDSLALSHEQHLYPVDHLARARALRQEGDVSGALTEARRALHDAREDPDSAGRALDVLIPLAWRLGQGRLAAEAQGELAHLFPDSPEPLVQQARLLLKLGDLEGAFKAAGLALELDPEDPEVYQVLGRAHLSAGHLDEAIVRFQQAVHLDPDHGYALNNLGLAWLGAGQNSRAAEALAQAAYLLPRVGFIHNNLGLAYERLGRYEEAWMAFDTATRLSPRSSKARLNRARLHHQLQASALGDFRGHP